MVYAPASFVMLLIATPVAVFVAVISTPGKIAFVASVTVPVSVALLICPNTVVLIKHTASMPKESPFTVHPLFTRHGVLRLAGLIRRKFQLFRGRNKSS